MTVKLFIEGSPSEIQDGIFLEDPADGTINFLHTSWSVNACNIADLYQGFHTFKDRIMVYSVKYDIKLEESSEGLYIHVNPVEAVAESDLETYLPYSILSLGFEAKLL